MVTRIKAPKYRVGRYSLNEYELRQLQLEVAEGKKAEGIIVTDQLGYTATIQKDGSLTDKLFGIDINSLAVLKMLAIKREKK